MDTAVASEADDGARTRDPWLGKPMLYQLSYVRLRAPTIPPARAGPPDGMTHRGDARKVALDDDVTITRTGRQRPPLMFAGGVAVTARQAIRREAGQTMAEYAVVLGVITPVLLLLFTSLLDPIVDRITTLIGYLT